MKESFQPFTLNMVIILKNNFSVGNRLRELRAERAMSQEQVANIAEVTTSYLGQVERGQKNITVYKLGKICEALNVSLEYFFSGAYNIPALCEDETSMQILHQLSGKSEDEKRAILRLIKLVFSISNMKS